jgi:lipopolysaccharide/colanic/teichoic acid biosynthesis glycosyltransferase
MILKRIFDVVFAFVGLVLLLPLLLLLSVLIYVKMSGGPIIFKQLRIGKNATPFVMYKFRTMTKNHSGSSVSVVGESRITVFGAKLRKYKLDELPELWNVLKGDMSFVGPRPDVPGYADKLIGEFAKVLNFKPGITGPASLKYRKEEELLSLVDDPQKYNDEVIFPDKVRVNLKYIENWTLWLDIKIIFCTIMNKDLENLY